MRTYRVWLAMVGLVGIALWGSVGCSNATPNPQESSASEPSSKEGNASAEPTGTVDDSTFTAEAGPEAGPEPTPEPAPEPEPTPDPYRIELFNKTRINSRKEYEGTTYENVRQATKEFEFKKGTYEKVELVVALRTTCYPFEQWKDDPRPSGHNWPPKCDAYDRNFEFVMSPVVGETDPKPTAFELVRAITPFGGPMDFRIDVTHLANTKPGKHTMKVSIGTWSDGKGQVSGANGGWFVSAYLDVTPGPNRSRVIDVIPLFNTNYKDNEGKKEEVKFTLPEGTRKTVLEYRVTGHGGGTADQACIGHADEFCKRTHRLFADGKEYQNFTPWRSDCTKFCTKIQTMFGTRCKENPTGNIRSVEAPRANWCPGSLTQPILREIPAFQTPGEHTFGYLVEKVAKGGSWRVSATLIVYGE